MKNLLVLTIAFFLLVPCFGQMIDPLDEAKTREKNQENKIYKATQWSYKYENGKPAQNGNISVITVYNTNGFPVEVTNFNSGKISTVQKYSYDIKGNKSEYTNFDADKNKKTYAVSFNYNSQGLLIREDGYDGLSPYHTEYSYDSTSRMSNISKFDEKNVIEERWDYSYADTVSLIAITKKGKLTNKKRITKNTKGQTLEDVKYDALDKELKKTLYFYSANGQTDTRDEYVSGNKRYTHKYIYDKDNKLVQVIQIEPTGKQFPYSNYKYDTKGNLLQEQWSENKGTEYSRKESIYDPKDILKEVDTYYAPYEYQVLYKYTYEFYQ